MRQESGFEGSLIWEDISGAQNPAGGEYGASELLTHSRAQEKQGEGAGWPPDQAGNVLMMPPSLGQGGRFLGELHKPLICSLLCKAGNWAPDSEAPRDGGGNRQIYLCDSKFKKIQKGVQ